MMDGVVVPEVTEKGIYGFFGEYRYLSNFHMAPLMVAGRNFECSEAAYMAYKTDDPNEKAILETLGGKEAKQYGQKVKLREDWEQVKDTAMYNVLWAKFNQNEDLKRRLLATGSKYLEETNWWNDRYWGVCAGEGKNKLGELLMLVRTQLRKQA